MNKHVHRQRTHQAPTTTKRTLHLNILERPLQRFRTTLIHRQRDTRLRIPTKRTEERPTEEAIITEEKREEARSRRAPKHREVVALRAVPKGTGGNLARKTRQASH